MDNHYCLRYDCALLFLPFRMSQSMKSLFAKGLSTVFLLSFALMGASAHAQSQRVITDQQGSITIKGTPTRVIALEYSFVDALAAVGVSPVGVADDKNIERILPEIRELIKPWQSVGVRPQPSLEAISQLKPDLIIADAERHSTIYNDLMAIAPTILLKSRGETYEENLQSAMKIGVAVNKADEMAARIEKHHKIMDQYKAKLSSNESFQFAVVTDKGMWLHGPNSYAGGVITALGLHGPAVPKTDKAYIEVSFEQLLKINPDWLLLGPYKPHTVYDDWQSNPLSKMLKVEKTEHAVKVSPQLWSLNRGILAAEGIAKNLSDIINQQH
ncbi:Fe(3+) dicitrate ABC transporter substrate-binding protein [Vibrio sp. McD22-P3]|uniref:Fe(3+) dicitrate ABC transporter substrate-binding protein n=1 Tax=Vibrio sp. McD22-P3 TaxID=2724880 RepID=UPI003FCD6423